MMNINKIGMDNSDMALKLKDAGIDACIYDDTLILAMHNELELYKNDEYTKVLVDVLYDIITSYCYMDLRNVNNTIIPLVAEMIIIAPHKDRGNGDCHYSYYTLHNKLSASEKIFGYYNKDDFDEGYIRLNIEKSMTKSRLEELIKTSFNVMIESSDLNIKKYVDSLMENLYERISVFKNPRKDFEWKKMVNDLYSTIINDESRYVYLSSIIEEEHLYKKLKNYDSDYERVDVIYNHLNETGNSFESIVYRCLLNIFMFAPDSLKETITYVGNMESKISYLVNHTIVD